MRKLFTIAGLALFLLSFPILATVDKITKLTPAEIADVNDFMVNKLTPDPNWVTKVSKSKSFKGTQARSRKALQDCEKFRDKVNSGGVRVKKRVDGEYVEFVATMVDVEHITRLDRWFHSDPNYLEAILLKERCPLDGHLHKDDLGVDDE